MKRIFGILFCSSILTLSAQELKYEKVIKVDSTLTKAELFNRAKAWAKENYNSDGNLVSTEDLQLGEISGIGSYDYRAKKKYMGFSCVEGKVTYKFNVFLKNGRYKYVFYLFDHKGSGGPACRRVDYGNLTLSEKAPIKGKMIADDYAWLDLKEKAKEKVQNLASSLETFMNKKYNGGNDW